MMILFISHHHILYIPGKPVVPAAACWPIKKKVYYYYSVSGISSILVFILDFCVITITCK